MPALEAIPRTDVSTRETEALVSDQVFIDDILPDVDSRDTHVRAFQSDDTLAAAEQLDDAALPALAPMKASVRP